MKKSLTRQKTYISKIPFSKTSNNKLSLELSIPFTKKFPLKIKNDSMNKDTVDGSGMENQTYAFNQDSLNNSKCTINKNNSLSKLDNKLLLFTSSLKYSLNSKRNNSSNYLKNPKSKTDEEFSENIPSSDEDILSSDNNEFDQEDEDTNKIDYRYYPKIPEIEVNKDNDNPYFWLATYDKLMKKSKIAKILNYYSDSLSRKESEIFVIEDANSDYKEEECKERIKKMNEKYNFKEKTMIIDGYELYFLKKHGKPFIRQKKEGKLFIKLYLLNLEQINQIYSYINRFEYKQYIKDLNTFTEKDSFKIINNFNKSIYNYSTIFCLGSFMNTNIYLFSHIPKMKNTTKDKNDVNYNYNINDLPSSNKIAKIIKALMINFPNFSKQYFIDYLMKPKDNYFVLGNHDMELLKQKMSEVNSLLMTNNKRNFKININSTNNVIKNIVKEIPTNTPISFNSPYNINLNSISKSHNNLLENNYYTNNYTNTNDNNCSDFLSNIKNELDGLTNLSKSNIKDSENKKTNIKNINKKKLNNKSYTRNNINNNILNNNKSSIKTIYSLKGTINKTKNITKTVSLLNSIKKSLTRFNSNNYIHYNKINNSKKKNNSHKILNPKSNVSLLNKENNSNILNKNLINEYIFENKTNINNKNNNINNFFKNSDSTKTFKVTRNKNIVISPFYTNNNTTTNSAIKDMYTQNNNNIKLKKSVKVLSSIKKVISQKMNNLSENTTSIIKNNKNDSNSSLKINHYFNENLNKGFNTSKYRKVVCKTNNNSLNKKSDYITPLKKRSIYYYH